MVAVMSPAAGGLRVLRALVLLATVTGLVVAGHVVGGGAVDLPATLWLAALAWPAALFLSRRRVTVPVLALGLAGGQAIGHLLLSLLSGGGHGSLAANCLAHVGHLGHGLGATGCATDPALAAASNMSGMSGVLGLLPSGGMLLAHVVATALTTVLLARGEAMLWRAVDRIAPPVPQLAPLRGGRSRLGGRLRHTLGHLCAPPALGRAPPSFA